MDLDGSLFGCYAETAMVLVDGEEYLTVEEAARRLSVKPATLYAYVSRGILRSYRQGIKRRRLYRRADVEALVRLVPSQLDDLAPERAPEIPLAESWIRD
jgi:excisionase family DNA binding protein